MAEGQDKNQDEEQGKDEENSWLTIRQLAALLQIGEDKVRARVKTGTWPYFRDGRTVRFTPEHIQDIKDIGNKPVRRRRRSW
jgi:excisionase family DNA binding protein